MKNRLVVTALLGLATIGGSLLATIPNAQAATQLGGVSVAAYCVKNVSSGNLWVDSRAVNINNKWNGWRCVAANGSMFEVDMNKACRQQYSSDAYAGTVGTGASDWRCYRR